MQKDNLHSPVAITYAQALLELATEMADTPGEAQMVGDELAELRIVIQDEPLAGALLADPAISMEERSRLIERVFANRVSPLLLKFLHVLNEKGRLGFLGSIAGAYKELLDTQQGKVEVDVTVAQRLSPEQMEDVRHRVATAIKRDAVLHQYVDPTIIGGLILRIQDRLIDGSVRSQLDAMRQRLRAAHPA
jgi:F-type H+-transporting ATPase subunit delta